MAGNESVAMQYADTQAAVSNFQNQVANFEAALRQMNTVIDNLTQTFIGHGSQAFVGVTGRWTTDAMRLNQDLEAIASQLNMSIGTFEQTDSQVASGFKRLGA